MQRPTSLTIIGWLLIVFGVWGVIGQLALPYLPGAQEALAGSPLPASAHMAFGIVSALVSVVCGYGILKGLNWSRYLYMGFSALGIVFAFVTTPSAAVMVLSLAILALVAFFLFRAPANAWFTQGAVPAGE